MGTNDSVTFLKCLNWVLFGNPDKKMFPGLCGGKAYFIWKPHQREWSLLEWKSIVLKKTRESVNEHTHPRSLYFSFNMSLGNKSILQSMKQTRKTAKEQFTQCCKLCCYLLDGKYHLQYGMY